MVGGGLSARGSGVGGWYGPACFGSIHYVHVVNMKASILHAQQEADSAEKSASLPPIGQNHTHGAQRVTRKTRRGTPTEKQMRGSAGATRLGHRLGYSPTHYNRGKTPQEVQSEKEKKPENKTPQKK